MKIMAKKRKISYRQPLKTSYYPDISDSILLLRPIEKCFATKMNMR